MLTIEQGSSAVLTKPSGYHGENSELRVSKVFKHGIGALMHGLPKSCRGVMSFPPEIRIIQLYTPVSLENGAELKQIEM